MAGIDAYIEFSGKRRMQELLNCLHDETERRVEGTLVRLERRGNG